MLLDATDEDGSQMNDKQLRDELITLFLAGHETTANTLAYTWYLLSQNPEVEKKLSEELEQVLNGRLPSLEDLEHLTYTNKIVKESMRLYPPAWTIGREPVEDIEIGGYYIPKGTFIEMSQWVMHRDSRYYADPEVFNPDRWTPDFEQQLPKYAYYPFGGGPRMCIGNNFAMMETILLIATIAPKWRMKLVSNQSLELEPSITVRPKHGVLVKLLKK